MSEPIVWDVSSGLRIRSHLDGPAYKLPLGHFKKRRCEGLAYVHASIEEPLECVLR